MCGIPDVLYTDNGSDFTSNRLEQVGADLKIRLVFSIPGKPRGRGRIERFFATVNEMFLCELDGYAPAGGVVRGKPTLTLAEFDTKFRTFLLDVYHRRANAETKTPPVERWEANGFLPRMPDSLEQLDLLLIQVAKTRQVRVEGFTSRVSATSRQHWRRTLGKRSRCDSIRGTWRRSASFTKTSSCVAPSARNSQVKPFRSARFSVPGIGDGGNCAASCGTARAP